MMRDTRVRGAPLPPPQDVRYYPIYRPRMDKPVRGVVLSEQVWGHWTHWIAPLTGGGGRTKLCQGEGRCAHSHDGRNYHWYGVVGLLLLTTPTEVVGLLMHRTCAAQLLNLAGTETMRGLDVRCLKTGPAAWSPIRLEGLGRPHMPNLPEAPDLTDSLCKLWDEPFLPVFGPLLKIAEGGA